MLRVYIDMDHTFCDFKAANDIWKTWAVTEEERKWPWSMPGMFRSLPPMKGALAFWEEFYPQCELWFLTRPSIPNRHCYTEKADWIYRYLGEKGSNRLILSPKKDLLIGDILIDDAENCGQQTFQGEWWRFGRDEHATWEMVSEKLRNKLK